MLRTFTTLDTNDVDAVGSCANGDIYEPRSVLEAYRRICAVAGSRVLLCHAFVAGQDREDGFILYKPQDALNIDSMGPTLITSIKTYLEARASERSMDGPVSRMMIRHLCHLVSRPLSVVGLHPNYVTLAGALFAFLAVLLFLDGRSSLLSLGGICWLIGGILDEADGEVARLQGKESTFGSWLDLTLDRIFDAAMLLSLAWPLTASSHGDAYLILTLCALVAVSASSYTGLLYDSWMRSKDRHAYFRLGRDIRILIITVSALLGLRLLPVALCGAFAAIEILRRFWVCWYVERSRRLI